MMLLRPVLSNFPLPACIDLRTFPYDRILLAGKETLGRRCATLELQVHRGPQIWIVSYYLSVYRGRCALSVLIECTMELIE